MVRKQLIIAVEGTAAMGPFWKTVISDYLEKMIRSFTEADSIEQNPSAGDTELLFLVFNVHGSRSGCMLQRSAWTRDIDMFFQWLSAIPFSNGGFNNVAIAEGLAEALTMFVSLDGSPTQQNADGQRHCILVAASNPHLLPTPVYRPVMLILERSGNIEADMCNGLADAETVAKAFPQCSVSLSVICPRKLPKLRAIYNAGKRDPQAADPPVDTSKNPNFLVLISENFTAACAAFSQTDMESLAPNPIPVEMDMSSVPPVSGTIETSNPSVMNQQPISAENIPAAMVNIEPTMVTSVSGPAPPQIPNSQVAANLQSGSYISISEEMVLNNENTTPIVSVMAQLLGPFGGAAAHVGILNRATSSTLATPAVSAYGQLGVRSMSGFAPFSRTDQIAGMHQNVLGGMGTGMPSGIGTMMSTPGMTRQGQPGILPLGRNNSAGANMSLSHQQTLATLPSAQSGFVKFWEGNLYVPKLPEPVTRLQGYRKASASESFAANWPPTMQILHLISKAHMDEHARHDTEQANFLVFRAMEPHALLKDLQERNLCAVISLPSQTLILNVSEETSRLIGFLVPSEKTEYRPRIPNRQLRAAPRSQLQQQQQAQPLLAQLQEQQLPQATPTLLTRQQDVPLQQQPMVPRIHGEIPQQPPIHPVPMDQAYMQATGSSQLMSQTQASSPVLPSLPESVLVESDTELDN